MLSFNREQSRGEVHNIVIVVMKNLNVNIEGAMEWIQTHHAELRKTFMDKYFQVPRWGGPVDRQVAQYVDGLANWVGANNQWHFESRRYFGEKGADVQKTGWVDLLPPVRSSSQYVQTGIIKANL